MHRLAVGVIIYITVSVLFRVLNNVWLIVFPLAAEAPLIPDGDSTDQLKIVADTVDESEILVAVLLHIDVNADIAVTFGVGFTVIVTVFGVPLQVIPPFVYLGVTVIVAITGVVPELTAVKAGISPVPLLLNPMVELVFDHEYSVAVPWKLIILVKFPLHIIWFEACNTVGLGLTVIVNVLEIPGQFVFPFKNCGVTVIVDTIGAEVLLMVVNAMFPVLLEFNPMDELSFDHE